MDNKLLQWNKFSRLLNRDEQDAYKRLVSVMKNRRTAIDEADEPDIAVAMLLAAATHLENGLCLRQKLLRK